MTGRGRRALPGQPGAPATAAAAGAAGARPGPARPTVLTFIPRYLPGYRYGGPVQSLANLVEALGDEIDFAIVTQDRDLGDARAYPGLPAGAWTPLGKARVLYLPERALSLRGAARLLRDTPHDAVYLNSFHSRRLTILPLLAARLGMGRRRPVVLAPRGELSPGALGLKPLRKRLYRRLARLLALHEGILFQATAEHEAAEIRRALGDVPIRLAPNLPRPRPAPPPGAPRPAGGPLRLVFLSRISAKKNLLFALDVLRRVAAPVELSIFGPVEDPDYWRRCRSLIGALPAHLRATHHGAVEPDRVPEALAGHDLFFLPTLGENYGHAIAEALQAGLPLLISDRTPWRGLAARGIGRDLPLAEPSTFADYIEELARMDGAARAALGRRVAAYAAEALGRPAAVEANRALFRAVTAPPAPRRRAAS